MKKYILIVLLLLSGSAFAQLNLPAPFNKTLSLYTKNGIFSRLGVPDLLTLFSVDTASLANDLLYIKAGGGFGWKAISATSILPDSTGNTAKYLRVLAGGGFGWATPAAGSPYFKDDGGTPAQTPVITAGIKAYSIGDSVTTTGYGSISWGARIKNTGKGSLYLSPSPPQNSIKDTLSGNYAVNLGSQSYNTADYSILAGNGNGSNGIGSILLGYQNYDYSTSNVNDGQHGFNIMLGGYNQNNHATDNFNLVVGYNTQVYGTGNVAIFGRTATGTASDYNISIGWNSFISGASSKKYQVSIGTHNGNYPTGNFDSIMIFSNQPNAKANNTDEIVFGGGNINSSTDWAFQFGMGGKWGNASTFDVLSGKLNGTVTAGKNFVSGAQLGAATTPASGSHYQDNVIIAWGDIASDGTVNSQYGNSTIVKTATGTYTITLPVTPTAAICAITLQGATLGLTATSALSGAVFTIKTGVGAIATDETFNFIVTGRP